MAAILRFEKREKAEAHAFAADHTATILIFTGVRFERLETPTLDAAPASEAATPTRRAN